jgi:hypothetical protein
MIIDMCLAQTVFNATLRDKLAEFEALSWSERDAAIRKLVTEEGLATMLGEDAPASGAIDKCAAAIKGS